MTTTLLRLVSGSQLSGAAAAYYTAGTGKRAVIRAATLTNTTAGVIAATVHLVPSGGTAGAANAVISARNIAAGETYNCPELVNQVIEAGGSIQALGANLTLVVSGAEVT